MLHLRRLWVLLIGLAIGAVAVYGQGAEAAISVGAAVFTNKNLGALSATEALTLKNGIRISARLDINSWKFFGHEVGYGYNRPKLVFGSQGEVGMSVHQGFYDFMVHALPEGSPFRPFVCAGGGFSSFFPPGSSAFAGNGITKVGFNYGGGVKVKVSPIFGIRVDLRDYVTAKPFDLPNVNGLLHNIEASAGFAVLF